MIRISDLQEAIAECQGEKNPNAQTCIKLAAYYTILNQLTDDPPAQAYSGDQAETPKISYKSGSEFSDAVSGLTLEQIMPILDELVQTVAAVCPPLYDAFLKKLNDL